MPYKFELYTHVETLPAEWETVAAHAVLFQRSYLQALSTSAPVNMTVFFIGIYDGRELVGIAIAQLLDLKKLETFGTREKAIKLALRKLLFRRFAPKVLILGNNMLTGQHAFVLSPQAEPKAAMRALLGGAHEISRSHGATLFSFKDFYSGQMSYFDQPAFSKYFRFSTQPNMVLDIRWNNLEAYVENLHKKYRDQYKRARKKIIGLQKHELSLDKILKYEPLLYALYRHVATNAPFNTFFLSEHHFSTMKRKLGDGFRVFAYFDGDAMAGFYTTIRNGEVLDTYFLGYDNGVQKSRMLYLNMLYDMVDDGISGRCSRIVFSRTALEIKSSVGAVPEEMYGLMWHRTPFVQKRIGTLFKKMEPELDWQQRHPFKSSGHV